MSVKRISQIYKLLELPPFEVFTLVYSISGITIKNKLSIILNCLRDQKDINNGKEDPKQRNKFIERAAESLEELERKVKIRNKLL